MSSFYSFVGGALIGAFTLFAAQKGWITKAYAWVVSFTKKQEVPK